MPAKKDQDKTPEARPSGRSSDAAAAQSSSDSGRVTGDPKPPGREDPTRMPEQFNPAGAPLLPHPGVSSPLPAPEPDAEARARSTDQQMDEFAPQDRAEVEADREDGDQGPPSRRSADRRRS